MILFPARLNRTAPALPALTFAVLILAAAAPAQDDFFAMSLGELVAVEVDAASVGSLPLAQQPATVTVFNARDIEGLGARFLIDVLEHVPGVYRAVDVFGVNSLVFRGHWGHEGKILFEFDGMPLNDLLYGNLNLALHYPVEQIETVEVIHGPGPAKYGGSAQLAVIRVTSRAADRDGGFAQAALDLVEGTDPGYSLVAGVTTTRDDLKAFVSASLADLKWSGETWRDNTGGLHDLGEEADARAANVLARVGWKGLRLNGLFDRHESLTPHKHGDSRPGETVLFESWNLSAEYDWHLGDAWTVTPIFRWRDQRDWWISRDPAVNPISNFHLPARWYRMGLEATWLTDIFNLLLGSEYWNEKASAESAGGFGVPPETYFHGKPSVTHDGRALYAQGEWTSPTLFVSAGARYSDHSYAGDSLVPRVSLGYRRDRWFVKGHYGQAFRDPDIDVINTSDFAGQRIEPEKTTQLELEAGLPLGQQWEGSLALYRLEVENPIIYSSTGAAFFYTNNPESTTRGLDLALRGTLAGWGLRAGYGYYQAVRTPIPYQVEGNDKEHLGAPQHTATLAAERRLGARWALLPSLIVHSNHKAWDYEPGASDPDGDELSLQEQPAKAFLNLVLKYGNDAWTVTAGCYDVFDEVRMLPQPYNDASTPWSGPGRQWRLALRLDW